MSCAETSEIRIAGYSNLFRIRRNMTRAEGNDAFDKVLVGGGVGYRLVRVKFCILKELFGRPGYDETVMGIIWFWFVRPADPFTAVIKIVIPDQLIGIGKGVRLKIKRSVRCGSNLIGGCASGDYGNKCNQEKARRTALKHPPQHEVDGLDFRV